mgnify:CR=1 FL=1
MVTKKTTTKKTPSKTTRPKKTTVKKAPARKVSAPKKVAPPETNTVSAVVYDRAGKEVHSVEVPSHIFDVPKNDALLYQVVLAMEANARTPIAHTKTRGEVRGGGRKPWKQKGTGQARHGSRRSPIWRGGGVTFGPRNEKDYSQKINKKMRSRALAVVLSQKFRAGEVLFVDTLPFPTPQTSLAKETLVALSKVKGFEHLAVRRNNSALVAVDVKDTHAKKSFANLGNVSVVETRSLSLVEVLKYKYLVITNPVAALETLTQRMK